MNFGKVMSVVSTVGKVISSHKKGITTTVKVVTGVGAATWAITHAVKTVHDIEEAGNQKGEALTLKEKGALIFKNQWPALAMGTAYAVSDIALTVGTAKEIKTVTAENKSLIGQIAEIGNSYNMVNDIKNAMTKKVEELGGVEVAKDVKAQAVTENMAARPAGVGVTMPYSSDPKKISEWNNLYLTTGDTRYRVQEFVDSFSGQRKMDCVAHLKECEQTYIKMVNDASGRGYCDMNEWLDLAGFEMCDVGSLFGYRAYSDYFGISFCEVEIDGVAMMRIDYDQEPTFDYSKTY